MAHSEIKEIYLNTLINSNLNFFILNSIMFVWKTDIRISQPNRPSLKTMKISEGELQAACKVVSAFRCFSQLLDVLNGDVCPEKPLNYSWGNRKARTYFFRLAVWQWVHSEGFDISKVQESDAPVIEKQIDEPYNKWLTKKHEVQKNIQKEKARVKAENEHKEYERRLVERRKLNAKHTREVEERSAAHLADRAARPEHYAKLKAADDAQMKLNAEKTARREALETSKKYVATATGSVKCGHFVMNVVYAGIEYNNQYYTDQFGYRHLMFYAGAPIYQWVPFGDCGERMRVCCGKMVPVSE